MKLKTNKRTNKNSGFSLTELLVAISILGILSSIALPNYLRQIKKTRQNEASVTLSQLQQKLASYTDEYKVAPDSWKALSDYALIMTSSGPATEDNFLSPAEITLPGESYTVATTTTATDLYFFEASPSDSKAKDEGYNVMACVDLNNGATDIRKGPINRSDQYTSPAVNENDLRCR